MGKKYFVDTYGNADRKARLRAILYADTIAKKDEFVQRIVLYIATKANTGWFDKIFDQREIKKLFSGTRIHNIKVPIKIETINTYKKCYGSNDIVIAFGTSSEELYKLEDNTCANYIICIPWVKEHSEEWITSRNAINIDTGTANIFSQPSQIVIVALEELSNSINMSTGIKYPSDNERAKTYIRTLHKYEPELDGIIVEAYLVNSLNWETRHAQDVKKLIDTLNSGKTFQGGKKTGLQKYYEWWKKQSLITVNDC